MSKITIDLEVTDADRWQYVLQRMRSYVHRDADGAVIGYSYKFDTGKVTFTDVIEYIDEAIINQRFEKARR